MMTIAINLALNGSSLLFLIFIIIVYFSKKNMRNIDNSLYRLLLLFNFLNGFIHIFYLVGQLYFINDSLMKLIIRGYWIPFQCFCFILIVYIYLSIRESSEGFLTKLNNNKRIFFGIIFGFIIFLTILFLVLPFDNIYYEDGYINTMSGIAVIFFYIILVIALIMLILVCFIMKKHINKKKLLAFRIVLFFLVAGFILAALFPTFCITEFCITIINYVMFHTIENPDLQMLIELTLAKETAEKANNAKSEFLSSMSHELKTPLNAIVGLSQMIKDNSTDMESRGDAEDIYKAANNLLVLVDSILDINKLDSNNMDIVNVNYKPLDLFNGLENNIKLRIGEKPIEFRSKISPDLPNTLYGDKDKLKQIIFNLLTNAVKYTDSGFIDLSLDCINKDNKCNLRISVSDSGRGIKDDELNNLFTKFYRREEDKDTDVEGAGLGLAITKSLVDLMGGKISVDSVDGVGTTFFVTLTQNIVSSDSISNENTEIL